MKSIFRIMLIVVLIVITLPSTVVKASPPVGRGTPYSAVPEPPLPPRPNVLRPVKSDLSPPLMEMATSRQDDSLGAKKESRPMNPPAPHILAAGESQRDVSVVQSQPLAPNVMPAPLQSFDGVSNLFGGAPPDTQGDIGPGHYVQWINLDFAIWEIDKINHTSTLVVGPLPGNTLFDGFGGYCQTENDGDPITLYDQFSDRWLMSQFALPNYPNGPFYQCIAVSATSDPTGAWYRYAYLWSDTKMNDYPKFGVWLDAYYMTVNQFDSNGYAGAGVAAFERSKMITGDPTAQIIAFDLDTVNPNYSSILPADFDGLEPPPPGSPGIFLEWDDSTWLGDPADTIRIWEFTTDWAVPSNSTFGLAGSPNYTIQTANVDPNMCGYSWECIPQPDTTRRLDAISDRAMYRLQYRNFGDYQTLVTNHTVDVDGADHAGIYWFELRNPGGGWILHQEGVYSPDPDHRWMGSIAMDHQGNMALGYSVSSGSTYPSARYTGRLVNDPAGLLTQGEATLIAGSGSQTGYNRWGDYSMMAVDPFDDCTFWYTQEYVEATGSNTWKTRIGSFRFPSCTTGPAGTLSGTITDLSTSLPIPGAQISGTGSTPPNAFITFSDDAGEYGALLPEDTYDVTASSFGYLPESVNNVAVISNTVTTQDFALVPAPSAVLSGVISDDTTGWPLYAKISVEGTPLEPIWTDPVSGYYEVQLPDGLDINLHVEAFVPGYLPAGIAFTLNGNTTQNIGLVADIDTCAAPGYTLTSLFSEDFESGYDDWTMTGLWNPESQTDVCGSLVAPFPSPSNAAYYGVDGSCSYATTGPGNSGSLTMNSPIELTSATEKLVFSSFENTEKFTNFDNRYVEISTDNGTTWTLLEQLTFEDTWYTNTIDLADFSGSSILIRFRFDTVDNKANNYFGWMLDDIVITQSCVPPTGGLVVGNVYDNNTNEGLTGAQINSQNGSSVKSVSTPMDPAIDDGFYSIFSPAGTTIFTSTMTGGYATDVQSVSVVSSDTVKQDFYLDAGYLGFNPENLSSILDIGSSEIQTATINNTGALNADFEIVELAREQPTLGPFDSLQYLVKPFKQGYRSTEGLGLPAPPDIGQLAAGDILQSWLSGLTFGWGVGYNTENTDLWIGDIAAGGGSDLAYRFLNDGTNTGDTIDLSWAGVFAADMTYNPITKKLWVMDVGGDDCIHELDPISQIPTGNKICPPFSASQRGLAYDPMTDTYFAGSWNDEMIHRFSSDGVLLSSKYVGLATAGLAYNPETMHLFVVVNDAPNPIYVLDAADNLNILGQFSIAGFSDYGGAGLEMDCEGNLWAIDQQTQDVYQVESGETTNLCTLLDLPWLSADPITGIVSAAGSQGINVNFDASVPEIDHSGGYLGQFYILSDTPYSPINIPVTMTVDTTYSVAMSPASDGQSGDPGQVVTYTLTVTNTGNLTDTFEVLVSGYIWNTSGPTTVGPLAQGASQPLQVGVEIPPGASGGASDTASVSVTSQGDSGQSAASSLTTTANSIYGVQLSPSSDNFSGDPGQVVTYTLTLTNTGNTTDTFDISITGDTWTTNAPTSVGPLASNASQPFQVSVEIPITASGGDSDTVSVIVTSQTDSGQSASSSLTSTANGDYGVELFPASDSLSGDPGQVVTYTLAVTNTGNLTDTFNVLVSGYIWNTSGPTTVGPLAQGASQPLQVGVEIPPGASGGASDTASVSVTSQGDSGQSAASSLTTTANSIYDIELFPASDSLSGNPGQVVTYTLTVTNTGNTIDTFDISITGETWATNAPTTIGPLASYASQPFQVSVEIPITASGGEIDAASVSVTSQADSGQSASSSLTSTANGIYGVELFPASDNLSGDPGQVVTHTLTVTNSGNLTDTFDVLVTGNAWNTNSPTMVGPLAQGASQLLLAGVEIPPAAVSGESDVASISVTSQADSSQSASSSLTTTANGDYGVKLSPISDSLTGDPGQVVTYTLTVTNTGNLTDTFIVQVSGNTWNTSVPGTLGPLAQGASQPLKVGIEIPPDAAGGESDNALVSVTSQADSSQSASSSLTTTANSNYGVELHPASAGQSGDPGQVVTYTLTVTNTGNTTDTFDISITGETWAADAPTTIGPLASDGSQPFQVSVEVPITASGGDSDAASVSVTSQADSGQSASSSLTSTANGIYGVELYPASAGKSGNPGQVVTYTLTATNTGNLTDTFDVLVSGNDWNTSVPTTVGPLAKDNAISINIYVEIPLAVSPEENDITEITFKSQGDPSKFAQSNLTTNTMELVDLGVVKNAFPLTVTVGSQLTYTLVVTNHGSSDAENVVLTDTLPTEVAYIQDDSNCSHEFGIVSCELETLQSDDKKAVIIKVNVNSAAVLTNSAQVTSDQKEHQDNLLNNTITIESFSVYLEDYLPLIMK